jgi:peptidoglycan hydrolase-like protein with peptidoglycan-binding domain
MAQYVKGEDVAALRFLNSWYPSDPRLAADGEFDPATGQAACRFQGCAGLTLDPVAGAVTLAALHLACFGGT